MKRTPLKRGKPLERRTPLKRGGPLRRRSRPVKAQYEIEASAEWKAGLPARCANCGATASAEVRIEGHHVVRVQLLKDHIRGLRWGPKEVADLLWDARNRLPLCELCHTRHHRRLPALAWSLIERAAPAAIDFAREVGLLWRAKLDYDLEG